VFSVNKTSLDVGMLGVQEECNFYCEVLLVSQFCRAWVFLNLLGSPKHGRGWRVAIDL
jgi:hypothetical protein